MIIGIGDGYWLVLVIFGSGQTPNSYEYSICYTKMVVLVLFQMVSLMVGLVVDLQLIYGNWWLIMVS